MAVATVQTVSATTQATNASSLSATLTPGVGSLLLAWLMVARGTSATFTGGSVTWTEIGSLPNSAGSVFLWGATATAATALSVEGSYVAAVTDGKSILVVTELSGHIGWGVATATSVTGNTTLGSVTLTTTSANAAIYTCEGVGTAIIEGNEPVGYTVEYEGTVLGAAGDYGHAVASTADAGVAGAKVITWGTSPGTTIGGRRILVVEVKPSVTVTFNYNLLEHRVMRGAGRGVMRGVA